MNFKIWLRIVFGFRVQGSRAYRRATSRQLSRCRLRRTRLNLEALEDRTLLNNPVSTTDGLIAAINTANTAGGATTITLQAGTEFNFTMANNSTHGSNALPVINVANNNTQITIIGNGDVIERTGSNASRFFDVASGGSLNLQNLILAGGRAQGTGAAAEGGAIYSSGALSLSGVKAEYNHALGSNGANGTLTQFHTLAANGGSGSNAAGGGVFVSGGSLTLTNDTFIGNQAVGGVGGNGGVPPPITFPGGYGDGGGAGGAGGNAFGGAVYLGGGVSVTGGSNSFSGNYATGGAGGIGGAAGNGAHGAFHVPPAAVAPAAAAALEAPALGAACTWRPLPPP